MESDGMGASMMWAGALMAFTPIIAAAIVIGIWWYLRKKKPTESPETGVNNTL